MLVMLDMDLVPNVLCSSGEFIVAQFEFFVQYSSRNASGSLGMCLEGKTIVPVLETSSAEQACRISMVKDSEYSCNASNATRTGFCFFRNCMERLISQRISPPQRMRTIVTPTNKTTPSLSIILKDEALAQKQRYIPSEKINGLT
eukprot:TRINITY_DN339_c1_g1_i5.p1 TRINITY_DN339_c1_g1~~TRINITY_DN339_c1_g1_i5.p1  ORF type:complete len:145 (+),score=23.96 TRINITY_DN339_c1_g1_i5:59-493(+)